MYTGEEFETAFGQFISTQKPFIFAYFKETEGIATDPSLAEFHQKLRDLKHFYSSFNDVHDLWNQFNKELDRLHKEGFTNNNWNDPFDSALTRITQEADKIYNIDKIDNAQFF
jgi:hypothetical protein